MSVCFTFISFNNVHIKWLRIALLLIIYCNNEQAEQKKNDKVVEEDLCTKCLDSSLLPSYSLIFCSLLAYNLQACIKHFQVSFFDGVRFSVCELAFTIDIVCPGFGEKQIHSVPKVTPAKMELYDICVRN
jgi:hypothetical protein